MRIAAAIGAWIYLAVIVGLWFLLHFGGDRWWPATVLLFGPRWLCSIPLLFLAPFIICVRPKLWWTIGIGALITTFPILGLQIPWIHAVTRSGEGLRVLTFNTCVGTVREDRLAALIHELRPDVVGLQECQSDSYVDLFRDWHVYRDGELLLAARFPISVRRTESSVHPPHLWPRATLLECVGEYSGTIVSLCTIHLPSPRYGLSQVIDKATLIAPSRSTLLLSEIQNRDSVSSIVARIIDSGPRDRIVMGDFNMPTDSILYRRDWATYANAFSATGWGFGYTMRPSIRGLSFGIRIDHVITDGRWTPTRCWVGPDLGSDHLPVIADLVWQGPRSDLQITKPRENFGLVEPVPASDVSRSPSPKVPIIRVFRRWKSVNGYTIEAEFVRVVDGTVRLKKADGKRVIVSMDKLSIEDQEFVRSEQKSSYESATP